MIGPWGHAAATWNVESKRGPPTPRGVGPGTSHAFYSLHATLHATPRQLKLHSTLIHKKHRGALSDCAWSRSCVFILYCAQNNNHQLIY